MATPDYPHPREQAQLFGFTDVERELAAQFRAGTLHHSLLITGPKSIGKATLAYRFARFVLSGGADLAEPETHPFSLFGPEKSETPSEGDGALYMPASHGIFKRVASGSHPDMLTVEPAFDAKKGTQKDEIQADVARKMGEFLSLTAAEGEYRVVVIDAADQLNEKAANALLKSIEEPPAQAFVLIVCHNPLSILPTIRSRCRAIKLRCPDLAAFAAVLAHVAPAIPMQDYDALYTLAAGAPGFALHIHAADGVRLYREVLEGLSRPSGTSETLALAAALAGKRSAEGWGVAKHVMRTAMERAALADASHLPPVFAGEAALLQAVRARLTLAGLLEMRDRMIALLRDTDTLNLDHTQAVAQLLKVAAA